MLLKNYFININLVDHIYNKILQNKIKDGNVWQEFQWIYDNPTWNIQQTHSIWRYEKHFISYCSRLHSFIYTGVLTDLNNIVLCHLLELYNTVSVNTHSIVKNIAK